MEQKEVYASQKDLVEWLNEDLQRQRDEKITEDNLTLNIGYTDQKGAVAVKINFVFDFKDIISKLTNTNTETGIETKTGICPYVLNCVNVVFEKTVDFKHIIFQNKVDFKNAVFNKESSFFESSFEGEAFFRHTTFNEKIHFGGATFQKDVSFGKTKFEAGAWFKETTFNHEVVFSSTKIENTLEFDNITLDDKTFIKFSHINYDETKNETKNSKIIIKKTIITGRIDFNNVCIKEIDFKGSSVIANGTVNQINLTAPYTNWETARLFKHEAIKNSNTIDALKYNAEEKDLYKKELGSKKKSFQEVMESLSIGLSKLSNNHGQNWGRAVLFTAICGIVFFGISYLPNLIAFCLNPEIGQTWVDFIYSLARYFIPVDYSGIANDGVNAIIIKPYFIPVYLLGKIAVAYGAVEVVQAFRKLK